MIAKTKEKELVLKLRKQGLSYNEILKEVDIAKSTLSVWLRGIGVAKRHQQRFTEKRRAAQQKAQQASRNKRVTRETEIIKTAQEEIGRINRREFWLIGAALYWAEGSKQKANIVSQKVSFNNSDPKMILLFDKWLKEVCCRKQDEIIYSLYIHKTGDLERARKFWGCLLNTTIERMYFKNHTPKTKRKYNQDTYFGLLRIEVRKSTDLNRRIKGWNIGISEGLGM